MREVFRNIQAQAIGGHTVADLNLPNAFLQRVADRIIRASFFERFRMIVGDASVPAPPASPAPPALAASPPLSSSTGGRVGVRGVGLSSEAAALWAGFESGRVECRSFKAPIVPDARLPALPVLPGNLSDPDRAVAGVIAKRLARDGILYTLASAIEQLGAARFTNPDDAAIKQLAVLGLPVDLLDWFTPPHGGRSAASLVSWVAQVVQRAGSLSRAKRELGAAGFTPAPSRAGFVLADDAGGHRSARFRIHITRPGYWKHEGEGGSLDILRGLLDALPEATVLASVEEPHAAGAAAIIESWGEWGDAAAGRVTLLTQPLPISQWAQDNAAAGMLPSGGSVVLAPRYATRGEDPGEFVPGDSLAAVGLAGAGVDVAQSPLLFQRGNLVCVHEGVRRTLLIGEAEVVRNITLGLSAEQALEAFRVEFGVDRCIVLPAASFHIDFEVSVRATPAGTTAFVVDEITAARSVLGVAIRACAARGLLPAEAVRQLEDRLNAGDARAPIAAVLSVLKPMRGENGSLISSAAGALGWDGSDASVGALQRVLLAVDILAAELHAGSGVEIDGNTRAMLETFRRRSADRRVIARRLQDLGWRVVPIPSLSEEGRSTGPINAAQLPGACLAPAYGAPLDELDREWLGALAAELPREVRSEGVRAGDSLRRSGGVRCAIGLT